MKGIVVGHPASPLRIRFGENLKVAPPVGQVKWKNHKILCCLPGFLGSSGSFACNLLFCLGFRGSCPEAGGSACNQSGRPKATRDGVGSQGGKPGTYSRIEAVLWKRDAEFEADAPR